MLLDDCLMCYSCYGLFSFGIYYNNLTLAKNSTADDNASEWLTSIFTSLPSL